MNEQNKHKNEYIINSLDVDKLMITLKRLMRDKGNLNETQLAKSCNLPQPTIHRILSGHTTDPRMSTLVQIADYLEVSLDQLIGKVPIDEKNYALSKIKTVPIISWRNAIEGRIFTSSLTLNNWEHWAATETPLSKDAFVLVTKPSMAPRFPPNTLLFIEPEKEYNDGDLVIVFFKNTEEATIRELIIDGPTKELRPILPETDKNLRFNTDLHHIIGSVIQARYDF
jgi:SOS-response transcriptional repressor LexA